MAISNTEAARGTAVLVFSQACFFVLGYFAVVLLAREFGPVTYGAYGVIMSVLVWLEESGRFAIPSATAKLVAETNTAHAALERAALTLNLAVHAVLFVLLWVAAPWLASWFGIANGTFLFRIAAIDLPFFGAYTAYRAIHQGHRRFFQLGCSQVIYAFTKLAGVLLLVRFGLSVESALLVNVAATIVGLAWLLPGGGLRWQGRWLEQVKPLVSAATPMGLYYFVLGVRDSLVLWTLQVMTPASEAATIGVFVAAFNIARVPSMVLTTVTTVILPSLSRALALNDESLARPIYQSSFALRRHSLSAGLFGVSGAARKIDSMDILQGFFRRRRNPLLARRRGRAARGSCYPRRCSQCRGRGAQGRRRYRRVYSARARHAYSLDLFIGERQGRPFRAS